MMQPRRFKRGHVRDGTAPLVERMGPWHLGLASLALAYCNAWGRTSRYLRISCDRYIAAAIAGDDIERRSGGSIGIDIRNDEIIDAQHFGCAVEIIADRDVCVGCDEMPQCEVIGVSEYAQIRCLISHDTYPFLLWWF